MKTLTTKTGSEIITFKNLTDNLFAIDGSCSRGHQTYIGEFLLSGNPVTIYKHWSTEGNYGIFTGENLNHVVGEIIAENWFPLLDENGIQCKDENGIYDLMDCNIEIKLHEN